MRRTQEGPRITISVEYVDTPWGKEAVCKKCGSDVAWVECENCDDGYSHHDCGEDTCCCLDPYPNVPCDICNGEGGWHICLNCTIKSKELRTDSK